MDQATSDWLLGKDRGWKPRWNKAYEKVFCAMKSKAEQELRGWGLPSETYEDVMQEAWYALLKKKPWEIGNLEAMAVSITRNKAVDARRRVHPPEPEDAEPALTPEEAYVQAASEVERRDLANELMDTVLDDQERRFFIACIRNKESRCQVAAREGCSPQWVGRIVARATRKLNRAVNRRLDEGG